MTDTEDQKNTFAAKKLARLVAVQALYRASFEQETLGDVIHETLDTADHLIDSEEEGDGLPVLDKPDADLFSSIVNGVMQNKDSLTDMIKGALDERHSFDRMEKLLRAVFLSGAYELHNHPEIQSGIIINDYVDVARAFYNAKEPALVNAILDKLAKTLRS